MISVLLPRTVPLGSDIQQGGALYAAYVEISNFRNIASMRLEPSPSGVTAITGFNGQGKSSVIEALAYALSGRSFRSSPKESLVAKGADQSIVRMNLVSKEREILVELALNKGKSDKLMSNRNNVSRSEMARLAPLTIFTPRDIEIIAGPPAERRDFVDSSLIAMGPRAGESVENFERLLRHRSSLLRDIAFSNDPSLSEMLLVFDERIAEEGERLTRMRLALLAKIEPVLSDLYAGISGESDRISITYNSTWGQDLRAALVESRIEDIKKGATSVGPHRDEIVFTLHGLNARYEASQGEQRTLAFSLKMALHELIRDRLGEDPIVLLDDVFSELDERRIEKVLEIAKDAQVVVTTSVDQQVDTHVKLKLKIVGGVLE